jgi:hypothetical protein
MNDLMEVAGGFFLVEDVRPTADGEFLGHRCASRMSKEKMLCRVATRMILLSGAEIPREKAESQSPINSQQCCRVFELPANTA